MAPGDVLTINPATLPNATGGTPYSQLITAGGGTAPYSFALTAGSLPAGLTLAPNGTLAGTPTTLGSFTFTVRATDANGDFGTRQYTLVVQAACAGTAGGGGCQLAWIGPLTKTIGEPAFDLPNPSSPSAGGFTFTSSNPSIASVSGRTVTLLQPGTVTLTATQAASGVYASATATTTLTIGARPDPTRDPGVVAGFEAKADAANRFADAQQRNIGDRLRQVRMGSNASQHSASVSLTQGGGESMSVGLADAGEKAMPKLPEGWGLWTAGTLSKSDRDGATSLGAMTDGLTIGVDRKFGDQLLLGVAGGMGWSTTDYDQGRSQLEAEQSSVAGYGLWRLTPTVYLDGVLGWGELDFTQRRYSREANAFARAAHGGDQWFGTVTLGHESRLGGTDLTTYARYDIARSELDAHQETGAGIYDLSVSTQTVRSQGLAAGLRGSFALDTSSGTMRPHWMLEYRSSLQNSGDVNLNYVRAPLANDYGLRLRSYSDDLLAWGLGLDAVVSRDWHLSVLYSGEYASGTDHTSHGLLLRMSWQLGVPRAPVDAGAVR